MRFKRPALFVVPLCCLLPAFVSVAVAQQKSVKVLFRDLQAAPTTDDAFRQFLLRRPQDPGAKSFLSRNLPQVLAAPPKSYETYMNNVRLAANFRIAAAIPALIGVIDCATPMGSTLHSAYVLDAFPCAKALVQIGDPAVPALAEVLADRTSKKGWFAYRALALIHSPRSLSVLRDYLAHDPDPELKSGIEDALRLSKNNQH